MEAETKNDRRLRTGGRAETAASTAKKILCVTPNRVFLLSLLMSVLSLFCWTAIGGMELYMANEETSTSDDGHESPKLEGSATFNDDDGGGYDSHSGAGSFHFPFRPSHEGEGDDEENSHSLREGMPSNLTPKKLYRISRFGHRKYYTTVQVGPNASRIEVRTSNPFSGKPIRLLEKRKSPPKANEFEAQKDKAGVKKIGRCGMYQYDESELTPGLRVPNYHLILGNLALASRRSVVSARIPFRLAKKPCEKEYQLEALEEAVSGAPGLRDKTVKFDYFRVLEAVDRFMNAGSRRFLVCFERPRIAERKNCVELTAVYIELLHDLKPYMCENDFSEICATWGTSGTSFYRRSDSFVGTLPAEPYREVLIE